MMTIALMLALAGQDDEPRVLTLADFDRPPSPEVPAAAMRQRIAQGFATVECIVAATQITECRIVEEQPEGLRFGTMLLAEMRRAKLKPGVAEAIARFRLTVRFETTEA